MGKIATELEAYNIGGAMSIVNQNKCCTKTMAVQFGCDVSGTYLSNQLVQLADLDKKIVTYTATFNFSNGLNVIWGFFTGRPMQSTTFKYLMLSMVQTHRVTFNEGASINANKPAGGSMGKLAIGATGYIYSYDSGWTQEGSFTHKNANYTVNV